MPNRIIKESTFESEKIASLSDFEFRLWIGLITQADDAGRGDARPAIIKGRVFALRDRTTVRDIDNALHALAAAGCIDLYNVGGRSYFRFPSWAEHQRIRDIKPKYPGPEDADPNDEHFDNLPQSAAICGELPQTAANCGLNPIQSNTNPNTNPNTKESTRARAFTPPSVGEVADFAREKGYDLDAEAFCAYYTANGWKVGKNPMKDWKAAVVTWVKRDAGRPMTAPTGVSKRAAARNAQCQRHDVISPGMAEAARKILEEDV